MLGYIFRDVRIQQAAGIDLEIVSVYLVVDIKYAHGTTVYGLASSTVALLITSTMYPKYQL